MSALTGVVAVGLCTLFAAQRLLPQAEAQEADAGAAPARRQAKSAPSKGPTKQRSGAKVKNKKPAVPAGRRADPFPGEPTTDRYAATVEPDAFDENASSLESPDSSDGANAGGRYAPGSTRGDPFPAKPRSKKQGARKRVPTPALDRRAVNDTEVNDTEAPISAAADGDGQGNVAPAERETGPRSADRRAPRMVNTLDEPAQRAAAGDEGTGKPGGRHLEGAQAPSLSLEKSCPDEIQVGKPATFSIRVRNTGKLPARAVEIHDEIPLGTRLVSTRPQASPTHQGQIVWSLGTLEPGDEAKVELDVVPLSEGEIGSVATVHFAGEASARTRCTRPQLSLEVHAPREVLLGEKVTLSLRISNPGTGVATGVVLSESIPEQLTHPAGPELEYEIGDLAPNESREIELTMTAAQAGAVLNQLVAKADGQLLAEGQAAFDVVAPQLKVAMQGPKRRYLERQATYTVSISNPGTAAAKEVELVTHLPKGMKFVEANNSGEYDPQTNTVRWLLDELPPNEIGEVLLTTLPIEAGEQTVRVEGSAQSGLKDEQQEVISVEGVAAILFQVVDLADPVEVGGETTYEVHVVNQGSKTATNVQLLATLPPELKPTGAEGPTRHEISGQQVQFQPLAKLAPKAETTYRIHVEGLAPGDLRVEVQLLTDEMSKPVTKEESTRVYADE
ncbi:MAG: COG1361 family protein [Terriglobales bacterium]